MFILPSSNVIMYLRQRVRSVGTFEKPTIVFLLCAYVRVCVCVCVDTTPKYFVSTYCFSSVNTKICPETAFDMKWIFFIFCLLVLIWSGQIANIPDISILKIGFIKLLILEIRKI